MHAVKIGSQKFHKKYSFTLYLLSQILGRKQIVTFKVNDLFQLSVNSVALKSCQLINL